MFDKNQIYLRDEGPIILGINKIVIKKTFILFEEIEELTKLIINSKEQKEVLARIVRKVLKKIKKKEKV